MASQEQMQSFMTSMSVSTASGENEEDETSSDDDTFDASAIPTTVTSTAAVSKSLPKMRIKLSLRMPKNNVKIEEASQTEKSNGEEETLATNNDEEVSATVVESDVEDVDDDAVISVVAEGMAPDSTVLSSSKTSTNISISKETHGKKLLSLSPKSSMSVPASNNKKSVLATRPSFKPLLPTMKRRPTNPSRPLRLPPTISPGLLIPSSLGIHRGVPILDATPKGFLSPSSVFDHAMSLAGYTTEGRTDRPHRGSSIQRVVGDMFDTDVMFSNHFPPLVPPDFFNDENNDLDSEKKDGPEKGIYHRFLNLLKKSQADNGEDSNSSSSNHNKTKLSPNINHSRKRQRTGGKITDMIPLSLTITYPESYINKRLKFVKQVQDREKAIVAAQQAEEENDIAREQNRPKDTLRKPLTIPPIPKPPSPPRIDELEESILEDYEDKHPLYPPKNHSNFVSHVDPSCFNIVDGRYFGLKTNFIADPHFCGPNAPGIMGLTVSCSSGLATSTASSGGGGAAISTINNLSNISSTNDGISGSGLKSSKSGSKKSSSKHENGRSSGSSKSKSKKKSHSGKDKKKRAGPPPTATAADLRKAMEQGGDVADTIRLSIIRAAVHASRSGQHGQSFVGPNGQCYPDVSKAFAAHASLKPCTRCKNNKQGAYHCRLRRKHKDLDHDGGNSAGFIEPLFHEPLDNLLYKTEKVRKKKS